MFPRNRVAILYTISLNPRTVLAPNICLCWPFIFSIPPPTHPPPPTPPPAPRSLLKGLNLELKISRESVMGLLEAPEKRYDLDHILLSCRFSFPLLPGPPPPSFIPQPQPPLRPPPLSHQPLLFCFRIISSSVCCVWVFFFYLKLPKVL